MKYNLFELIGIWDTVDFIINVLSETYSKYEKKKNIGSKNSDWISRKTNTTEEEFRSERIRRDEIIRNLLAHGYDEDEIKDMLGNYLGKKCIEDICKEEAKANKGAVA